LMTLLMPNAKPVKFTVIIKCNFKATSHSKTLFLQT